MRDIETAEQKNITNCKSFTFRDGKWQKMNLQIIKLPIKFITVPTVD